MLSVDVQPISNEMILTKLLKQYKMSMFSGPSKVSSKLGMKIFAQYQRKLICSNGLFLIYFLAIYLTFSLCFQVSSILAYFRELSVQFFSVRKYFPYGYSFSEHALQVQYLLHKIYLYYSYSIHSEHRRYTQIIRLPFYAYFISSTKMYSIQFLDFSVRQYKAVRSLEIT